MMRRPFCAAFAALVTWASAAEGLEAPPLGEAEVARAQASVPKVDARGVVNRLGEVAMGPWVSDGKVPGRVLFADDFASGSFTNHWIDGYAQKGMIRVRDDGRGGKCLFIPPRMDDFNCVSLTAESYVPVDPTHPVAVLWEARQSDGGNTPMLRVDFYDENRKTVRGEYQFRSSVDPTQPTLFQRNAHLPSGKWPLTTRYLRLQFHVCPKQTDEFPGEIARVRVVDLSDEVNAALRSEEPVKAERAAAAPQDVLAYVDDNLTDTYPVMPLSATVPGRAGATLRLRECPGEKTRSTVVLWSKTARRGVTVEFSDLRRGSGGTIPASALSAKVVKAHYQALGAPSGFLAHGGSQVLVPELLLNDDSLVIPDHAGNRNLVKYQWEGKSWYVDINAVTVGEWNFPIPLEKMPITDAKTLQPFDLRAAENKQLAVRVAVPKDAKAGTYAGTIAFRADGVVVAKVPVELEVLPFALPEHPETAYDPAREYTMGLYVWCAIDFRDGRPSIGNGVRSRAQVLAEFRTLVDNGVRNPTLIWFPSVVYDDGLFRQYLDVAREAGFRDALYLGGSGLIGNPTNAADLAALQRRVVHAKEVAREFGFGEVYFYGFDEARGERLLSQIPAWKAVREVGGKVIVSGYSRHFKQVGKWLDICVYADDPGSAVPSDWHSVGGRLWKYNTPQSGPEDPGIFRRNYGLDLWRRGFDGANTYCNIGNSACWNDLNGYLVRKRSGRGGMAYRSLCMVYPTTDGVIETLALTGLDSAIKDVRYMSLFRRLLRERPNAAAQKWLDAVDFTTVPLGKLRRELVDWILRVR